MNVATLLFLDDVVFPTGSIAGTLSRFAPTFRWQCGDDDRGGPSASFARPQTIIGRDTSNEPVIVCVHATKGQFVPASGRALPRHECHVSISAPTTDDAALAFRVTVLVALGVAGQGKTCSLQLEDGGNWLDFDDMSKILTILENDGPLRDVLRLGSAEPDSQAAGPIVRAATAPDPEPLAEKHGKGRLGTFTILLDADVHIDWPEIDEAMRIVDPDGNWHSVAVPGGMGMVLGRANIILAWSPVPVEPQVIADGYARSFWFDGDPARVARHRQQIAIFVQAPEDFEGKLATAKIATIIVGLIAKLPQVAAVYNHEVCTIFSAKMAMDQTSILASGELPIQLWTWTAFESMADGNVSMTTGGLMPLLGYELEVWNAPHPVKFVLSKLNETLRYLLISGPVIKHGDTVGELSNDQSVRCFFGPSRANRPVPIDVMFLEFDTGRTTQPRPDLPPLPSSLLPPTAAKAAAPQPQPLRRVGGFARKGL